MVYQPLGILKYFTVPKKFKTHKNEKALAGPERGKPQHMTTVMYYRSACAACLRREADQLRFAPRQPWLIAGVTCGTFLAWALVGYLLPETEWDRDEDGRLSK